MTSTTLWATCSTTSSVKFYLKSVLTLWQSESHRLTSIPGSLFAMLFKSLFVQLLTLLIIELSIYICTFYIHSLHKMLTENLIQESKRVLTALDYEGQISLKYLCLNAQTINYCINLILNQENKMKIQEFIEISEEEGDSLTNTTLTLISALLEFNCNLNEIQSKIKLLRFDKQRSAYFLEKINENLYEIRKIAFKDDLENLTKIEAFDWRFEVQLASKTLKNTFKPNVYLQLQLKQPEQPEKQIHAFNSDFGNLKNLQYQLNQALKTHRNPKYKTAKNSSV